MFIDINRAMRRAILPLLLVTAAVSTSSARVQAQDALDVKSATHVRNEYLADLDTIHTKILALANAIPADKYSWRPAPGVRSISEALMHVASEFYFYVPMSIGGPPPSDFGVPKEKLPALEKITAKQDVLAELEKSWSYTQAQVNAADPAKMTARFGRFNATLDNAAFVMTGDLHEHLGQLIVYARSVGVKPPWTK